MSKANESFDINVLISAVNQFVDNLQPMVYCVNSWVPPKECKGEYDPETGKMKIFAGSIGTTHTQDAFYDKPTRNKQHNDFCMGHLNELEREYNGFKCFETLIDLWFDSPSAAYRYMTGSGRANGNDVDWVNSDNISLNTITTSGSSGHAIYLTSSNSNAESSLLFFFSKHTKKQRYYMFCEP